MAAPTTATEHLLPVLVHVQANLSEDLSLEQVAQRAELSPFHFHRLFHDTIGETLKQYTQRLRLERAAYHLKIQDTTILDIAFNLGFNSHEAFTRAFKRWFGVTPRQFRLSHGRSHHDQAHVHRQSLNQLATTYQLSRVTVQKLNPIPVAFIRHLGSYLEVDTGLFDALIAWADARGLYTGDNLLIGVGHDDPNITSADKTRFDVCLSLPEWPGGHTNYPCRSLCHGQLRRPLRPHHDGSLWPDVPANDPARRD
jgi:AraC family transcriptional regulator